MHRNDSLNFDTPICLTIWNFVIDFLEGKNDGFWGLSLNFKLVVDFLFYFIGVTERLDLVREFRVPFWLFGINWFFFVGPKDYIKIF